MRIRHETTLFPSKLPRRRHLRCLGAAAAFWLAVQPLSAADYQLKLPPNVTRPFIAPEIWATPMMDWQISDGRIEMTHSHPDANIQLMTHQLRADDGSFSMSVRLGELHDHSKNQQPGKMGFSFAVTGAMPDEYRSGLFNSKGIEAGVTTRGRLFIGDRFSDQAIETEHLKDLTLRLEADCTGNRANVTIIAVTSDERTRELARFSSPATKDALHGNLGLIARSANARDDVRFWFSDWQVSGNKVETHPDQVFGPLLWTQYTTHRNILKMTAHVAPVAATDNQIAVLDLDRGQGWETVAEERIDPLARTALFRLENWDMSRDVPYRVRFDWTSGDGPATDSWQGVIRRDPVDQSSIKLAALSCLKDYAFPNQYVAENVAAHDPDILFFTGDQIYEDVAGYRVVRTPNEEAVPRATLNYLQKWWLFGWSFRDLMSDRPTVIITDDHDVYHGNLWGQGGEPMVFGGSTSWSGGYNMHPTWVNMIQKTQTSHLPDPFDPTPVKQGITVYYTDLTVGGVSFAILEDRKFKSAPGDVLDAPLGDSKRIDHVMDPDFDPSTVDRPGLKLLGDRQLDFLERWAADWDGVEMKAVLSQGPLAAIATTHGTATQRLVADFDSNAWPQTGRNKALAIIRKAHALMINGDQHLSALVQQGIDEWRDAGWSYTCPGIANGYARVWDPLEPGKNRPEGFPEYTGDFLDGFGNRMTIWAVANRIDMMDPEFELEGDSMVDLLNSSGSGYGIVTFDKDRLEYTIESWPVYRSLRGKTHKALQHEGWPRTVSVDDQDGRRAVAHLPKIKTANGERPIVQVIDGDTGEILYTRRAPAPDWQPKVFSDRTNYQVLVNGKKVNR